MSLEHNGMSQIMSRTNRERKFQRRMFLGANNLKCESSTQRKFLGQFAPWNECSREREGQGANVPGNELARILLADSRERIGPGAIRLRIRFFNSKIGTAT